MDETVHLGRIAGVRVGANWSLLVVFWLIAWGLADSQLPHAAPGHSTTAYWVAGLAAALIFYACLLAHELAHAIVARRNGMRVEGIVLWLFGGVSKLEGEAADPDVELRMALAGPMTSLAAALAFFGMTLVEHAVSGASVLAGALGWLGWINGMLAVFNLAPALPLDGGRVLRAWLWRRSGDKLRATATAAQAGRSFGYFLIAAGILWFAAGAGLGGLWLVFIGWFLLGAAGAEAAGSVLTSQLAGVRVADVMTPHPLVAPEWVTIDRLLEEWIYPNRCSTFPLLGIDGSLTGLITLGRVKRVPPDARATVPARDVACPLNEVVVCAPTDELLAVLPRMNRSADQRAVVVEGGHVVGVVSPSDVTRAVEHAGLTHR